MFFHYSSDEQSNKRNVKLGWKPTSCQGKEIWDVVVVIKHGRPINKSGDFSGLERAKIFEKNHFSQIRKD